MVTRRRRRVVVAQGVLVQQRRRRRRCAVGVAVQRWAVQGVQRWARRQGRAWILAAAPVPVLAVVARGSGATLLKTRLRLKVEGFLFGSTGQFLRVGGRVGEGEGAASWKGVAKVGAKQSSFDFIS